MSEYTVGDLDAKDAQQLGRVHYEVWRATYSDSLSPEALDELDPERFADRWLTLASRRDRDGALPGGQVTRIGFHGGTAVGFVTVGPARDLGAPIDWQLWALNVLPAHHGSGLAQLLIADALGDRDAYLEVEQGNDRAIAFYTRQGFVLDGHRTERDDGMTELRMVRRGESGQGRT